MVDARLGEHGVVLELGLAERGAVAGNQDELGCDEKSTFAKRWSMAVAKVNGR